MAGLFGGLPYLGAAAAELEALATPPGMMLERVANTHLLHKNLSLAAENERLQEENARLMQATLAQERAMLVNENAFLQMQQMQMYAQQMNQALDPWGYPLPHCRLAQQPQPAHKAQARKQQAPHAGQHPPVHPPGSLRPRKGSKENTSRGKWLAQNPANNESIASTSASTSAAPSAATSFAESSKAERSDDGEDSAVEQTTIMMRNIPNNYTRTMLLELIDAEGFKGQYDLVYIPIDFNSDAGFGYAFINLLHPEVAEKLRAHFQSFSGWSTTSDKVCDVMWSGVHQGLEAHIERYRNSPVMHESVPDEFKPAIFKDGVRIPFPPPTRAPRAPRIRRRNQEAE
jgi:hypothetical protein